MTENTDSHIEAIGKLIKLTQQGRLSWETIDPNTLNLSNGVVSGPAFETVYHQTKLRIFSHRYKTENVSYAIATILSRNNESQASKYVSVTKAVLEIVDQNDVGIWQFPREKMLDDLLAAIKYKHSGAQDLIRDLLKE